MLALGSSVLAQNQTQAPKVKPGQEPTPESQAAQQYAHPPGVFINRPLTQITTAAETLLDDLEGRASDFFYNEASPRTGMVRDRAPVAGLSVSRVSSIAATGFGLTALCIAHKRNYLRAYDCEQRVEKTLAFLLEDCPHEHGFLYHFVDMESGQRMFGSELSSIDTALLLCGVLTCRQYFAGNPRIEGLATTFYRRVDWDWMLNGGQTLAMGWLPDQGFLKHRWDIYSELLTMYLLAIGSPTHSITAANWNDLQRPVVQFGGLDYISGVAPLFIHQYAHAWCDFRNVSDLHANYFTNSEAATRAHQLWCLTESRRFPVVRSEPVGDYCVGLARGLPGVGRAAGDGAAGRDSGALRNGGIADFSACGVLARAAEHEGAVQRQGVYAIWIRRCVPAEGQLVRAGHSRHRPGNYDADGGESAHGIRVGAIHEEP